MKNEQQIRERLEEARETKLATPSTPPFAQDDAKLKGRIEMLEWVLEDNDE
jgi:hypothetical protein